MLIEQLPSMPELIDDIFAWRPTSYQDYFTRSVLPGRGSALEAPPSQKQGSTEPYTLAGLCTRSGEKMREVLDRATKLVNNGPSSEGADAAQAIAEG
jgi:hypothetical protein